MQKLRLKSIPALFASVACTHALICCLAVMAVGAGLHLDAGQGTKILVITVEIAAHNAAADVFICLLLAHYSHLIKNVLPSPARSIFSRLRGNIHIQ